jgi:hypothetical protein
MLVTLPTTILRLTPVFLQTESGAGLPIFGFFLTFGSFTEVKV